jgi:fructokinase
MTSGERLYGGIEAGGTKFVCLVGTGPGDMRERIQIPTTTPDRTLHETLSFFRGAEGRLGRLAAVGIASFGPVDLRPDSQTYGFITSTPKPGWANVDIAGSIRRALGVPAGFDTDVNAAALAERRAGARHVHLPDDRHGNRRRRNGQRTSDARPRPPRDGARPDST